jgi:hypothetical protein
MKATSPRRARGMSILRCVVAAAIGLSLWLQPSTAAPPPSTAADTVGHGTPSRHAYSGPKSVTDYRPIGDEDILYDLNNDCVPDNFDAPESYGFDVTVLPGVPGDTTARHDPDLRVCCYPPRGQRADSLLVYVSPCRAPQSVQFRLYDSRQRLVAVLRTYHGPCPGYAYSGFMNLRDPARHYVLEVIADGLRFSRAVTLGNPTPP